MRSLPRFTEMSARARRSVNSLARWVRSGTARRASSLIGCRDRVAHAASSASGATRRNLLRGLRPTLDPALVVLEVVDLLLDRVGRRVERESLLPRRDGGVVLTVLDERVAEVLVDDGIRLLGLRHRALELLQRLRILSLLVVRPAEAVDEVAVVGLEVEGGVDELDRLVQILTALG